jgi:hypothetical protein
MWEQEEGNHNPTRTDTKTSFFLTPLTVKRGATETPSMCLSKNVGGLDLQDPMEALMALLYKWVVTACEPGHSNFKAILRYRLSHFQPPSLGSVAPNA